MGDSNALNHIARENVMGERTDGLVMELLLASSGRPPAPALPNLICGLLCLVVGGSAIRWRERIYKATVDGDKRWFGKGFGEFLERLQSPFWVGVAGMGIVLMGIAAICYATRRFFS